MQDLFTLFSFRTHWGRCSCVFLERWRGALSSGKSQPDWKSLLWRLLPSGRVGRRTLEHCFLSFKVASDPVLQITVSPPRFLTQNPTLTPRAPRFYSQRLGNLFTLPCVACTTPSLVATLWSFLPISLLPALGMFGKSTILIVEEIYFLPCGNRKQHKTAYCKSHP